MSAHLIVRAVNSVEAAKAVLTRVTDFLEMVSDPELAGCQAGSFHQEALRLAEEEAMSEAEWWRFCAKHDRYDCPLCPKPKEP